MKHNAIYELYPSVKRIFEDENGNFKAYDANNNEVSITDWNEVNTKANELKTAEQEKEINTKNNKASGKVKLKNLGLTDDEIKALIGA